MFWVDSDGQHGLIVAVTDQTPGVTWDDSNNLATFNIDTVTGSRAYGTYAGKVNTLMIATQQNTNITTNITLGLGPNPATTVSSAAQIAIQHTIAADGATACNTTNVCYADWYLPSLWEANAMANQDSYNYGAQLSGSYWTSQEANPADAFTNDFSSNMQFVTHKDNTNTHIRLIRAF